MSEPTQIEWTDATWNPVTGCTMASAGCTNCYAMGLAATRLRDHPSRAGLTRETGGRHVWTGEVRLNEQWLDQPLRWRRPRRIFVCAHGDLFHEAVPDEWIDRVFAVMAMAPHHTFQVLTKRPERARRYLTRAFSVHLWGIAAYAAGKLVRDDDLIHMGARNPLPNVWLGTSVEDQATADARIPHLLDTPAAVRFISAEPLLGPVNLDAVEFAGFFCETGRLDWVIVGGESGPGARPMHPEWARSLRDQCEAQGVAFFFKQWGEWGHALDLVGVKGVSAAPAATGKWAHPHRYRIHGGKEDGHCFESWPENHLMLRVGKARAGRLLDGREWNDLPRPRR